MREKNAIVVEDDPFFQEHLHQVLTNFDRAWHIRMCSSVEQGCRQVDELQGQLVLALVDLGLPDGCGTAVIERVRSRYASTPVLVISSFSQASNLLKAVRAGARGYILKDQCEKTLKTAIAEVLRGFSPLSPAVAKHLFRIAGAPNAAQELQKEGLCYEDVSALAQLALGKTQMEIALASGRKPTAVRSGLRRLLSNLGAGSICEAITQARSRGLI